MFVGRPRIALWLAALLAASSALGADGAPPPQADQTPALFLRLTRDQDHTPAALETPITRFAPANGQRRAPIVDLVAAVHIADKSYYQQLNREFQSYDAVLYELVAPEKSSVPRPGGSTSNHPLSLLQNGLKDILDLEFQLGAIDYTRANMIHADMSPDQFAESMDKRGESAMTMLARMIGYEMTRPSGSTDGADSGQLLLALFDNNRALALKRVLAEEFESSQGSLAALDGPGGSTLISGRNQVALKVLRKQIAAGKRKIAIFYGAAHMPDLERRLRAEFGLTPIDTRWIVAWNLKP